jgi:hypothetical protein
MNSQQIENLALTIANDVSENGRITDASNIEEWANEVEFEAEEQGHDKETVKRIGHYMRTQFQPA